MTEHNAQEWWEQFRKDNAGIISKVVAFSQKHFITETDKNIFLNAISTACYSASIFDGFREHKKKREDDHRYLEDRDYVLKSLDVVIHFMKRHGKNGTSLFNSAMFVLASSADKTVSALEEIKTALTTEVKCFTPPHSHQHGCFLYPSPVHADRQTTAPRMLAVNLIGLFRLYSSGNAAAIRQVGWAVPSTGKPCHSIVTRLVESVFPDSYKIDARSAEADFKKNSPGILILPWEQW